MMMVVVVMMLVMVVMMLVVVIVVVVWNCRFSFFVCRHSYDMFSIIVFS